MSSCKRNKDSIHKYLEPFFDAGVDELCLINVRKQYLKEYKTKWQREFRKSNKQLTISFNKKEFSIIEKTATTHNRKSPKFVKEAALAYCQQQFLFLNPAALNRIQELLIMNYTLLQELSEEFFFGEVEIHKLLIVFSKLEDDINETLKPEIIYASD